MLVKLFKMKMSSWSRFRNCKTSPYAISAFSFAVLACASLIIALSSPYWLESKQEAHSDFVRVGLWRICFKDYQHPSLQFDSVFDGCYSIHGHKSESIRNWLQPGWFILVQCLITCATLLSVLCVCLFVYVSLQVETEIKIFICAFVFVSEAIAALLAFLGVCVFGVMCFERSWIKFPKNNSLSWGYGFCVLSVLMLSCAATGLLFHIFRLRKQLHRGIITYHVPLSNQQMSPCSDSL